MAYERPDPFRRSPGGPFDSLERETYARARARGEPLKAAATAAGVKPAAAYDWEKHESVKERIRELRAGSETFINVSAGWLLEQLKQNAQLAREAEQFKASNEALGMIAKLLVHDPSLNANAPRALPPDVAPEDVQRTLTSRFHGRVRGREIVVVDTSGAETARFEARARRVEGESS